MSVARVSEISVTSATSFDDAIKEGIGRASKTAKRAWIKELHVRVEKGSITEYQVNMLVTSVED